MPETNDQPQEEAAPAAPSAPAETRDKAPVLAAVDKVREKTASMASGIVETATAFDNTLEKVLRTEDPGDAEPTSILTTPIYATADVLDGTAMLPLRQGHEIARDIAPAIPAAIRTIKNPFIHPIETASHLVNYFKNPARIVTRGLKLAKTLICAIPRRLQEFTNRAIKRPCQRFGAKIPIIGKAIIGNIGKGIGWIGNKLREGVEWATKFLDVPDDAIAGST